MVWRGRGFGKADQPSQAARFAATRNLANTKRDNRGELVEVHPRSRCSRDRTVAPRRFAGSSGCLGNNALDRTWSRRDRGGFGENFQSKPRQDVVSREQDGAASDLGTAQGPRLEGAGNGAGIRTKRARPLNALRNLRQTGNIWNLHSVYDAHVSKPFKLKKPSQADFLQKCYLWLTIANMTPSKRPSHVLRWVRETLDLTQTEMAGVLGCGEPTIRAIENVRREFSRKYAVRLAAQTGLDVERLVRNELGDPPPSPAAVRNAFIQAQKGDAADADFSPGGHVLESLPYALLLRTLVLQTLIAEELGPAGCLHTGFYDTLQKTNAKLLWKIPNTKTRQRVFQQFRDMGEEEIAERVHKAVEAAKEVTAAARSSTKKRR